MAGKSLQRGQKEESSPTKDNQSTITWFFSKQTANQNQNRHGDQIDPTKRDTQKIKSDYFSPPKTKDSTNPLRKFSKRRLSLKKSQDPSVTFDLTSESNSEGISEKKAEGNHEKEEEKDLKFVDQNPVPRVPVSPPENESDEKSQKEIVPNRTRLSLRKRTSVNNDSKDRSTKTKEIKLQNESSDRLDNPDKSDATEAADKTRQVISEKNHAPKNHSKKNHSKKNLAEKNHSKKNLAEKNLAEKNLAEKNLADGQNLENSRSAKENATVIAPSLPIPASSGDGPHLLKKRKKSSESPFGDVKNAAKQPLVDPIKKEENSSKPNEIVEHSNQTTNKVDEDTTTVTEDGEGEENKEETFRVPYYLENFEMMISQVLKDEEYDSLIDDEDRDTIGRFYALSECSQKLYVRLFARKLTWRMQSKLKYPQIAEDLSIYLKELLDVGFGISENLLTDLPDVLALLPATELKTVAKSFKYNCVNQTKSQIVELLTNHCKKTSASSMLFGINGQKQAETAMINRSKKLLGQCFKLDESIRVVFLRFLALFSLTNTTIDDDSADSISGKLFQMLQVNIGSVVFPQYTVCKKSKIFRQREDFIKYTEVILLESELFSKTEKKDWSGAFEVYVRAKKIYDENTRDSDLIKWDKNLPLYLRHCTSGYVFARIFFQGVELLQRQKDYKQACHVLQEDLLAQDVYACLHRGRWYERLTLNLDQHLKSPGKALDAVEDALGDPWVSPNYRLSLFLRAEKIGKAPNSKWHKRFSKIEQISIQKPPEAIITGRTLPHSLPGIKYQFMTEESEEGVTLCNVEQLVLNHYKNNGFPKGIHAEGSIVCTLFLLFFWEIVFMDLPDVFRCPFQTYPLDMMSCDFYTNRKERLDARLQLISSASIQELWDIMAVTWNTYFGVTCSIHWESWTSLEEIQGLVSCIGGEVLSGILGRYAKSPRHTRSGFPDLTLWNVETKQFKISEVKGPGDRLSTKQMLWLDHLLQIGVDAEVAHIKPIHAKKLTSE